MPDTGPGRGPRSWIASKSVFWGLRGIFASLLAGGAANALAAKDKHRNKDDDGNRESGEKRSREETRQERADRRERNSDEERDGGNRDRRETTATASETTNLRMTRTGTQIGLAAEIVTRRIRNRRIPMQTA